MRAWLRYLKVELHRSILSASFVLAVIAVFLLYLLSSLSEIRTMARDVGATVPYFFDAVNSFNSMMDILLIISALCYARSFCNDWQHRYFRSVVARTSVNNYCTCRATVCFISTFTAVLLGMWLYIFLLSIFFPMQAVYQSVDGLNPVFGSLLYEGKPLVYLMCFCVIKAASCGMWGMAALASSSYMPNTFIALVSPLILHKAYSILYWALNLPPYLSIDFLSEGLVMFRKPSTALIYSCSFFFVCSMLLGYLFCYRVKKVIRND